METLIETPARRCGCGEPMELLNHVALLFWKCPVCDDRPEGV